MYIYNVTINIDESVHDRWLEWMKDIHIPEVLATGKFTEARMAKVLIEEEMGGITYSVQYLAPSRASLQSYYEEDAQRLREETQKKFKEHFVAFRTELELISEQKQVANSATEFLFAYGTLREPTTQLAVFSRTLEGKESALRGHRIAAEQVAGLYPTLNCSEDPADVVHGQVYALSGTELLKADAYEGAAYERKKVVLESGIKAWVYLGRSSQ